MKCPLYFLNENECFNPTLSRIVLVTIFSKLLFLSYYDACIACLDSWRLNKYLHGLIEIMNNIMIKLKLKFFVSFISF